jgi:hypothetical protein
MVYTVLFGTAGSGRLSHVGTGPGQPLERPKSLTTKMLEDIVAKAKAD